MVPNNIHKMLLEDKRSVRARQLAANGLDERVMLLEAFMVPNNILKLLLEAEQKAAASEKLIHRKSYGIACGCRAKGRIRRDILVPNA